MRFAPILGLLASTGVIALPRDAVSSAALNPKSKDFKPLAYFDRCRARNGDETMCMEKTQEILRRRPNPRTRIFNVTIDTWVGIMVADELGLAAGLADNDDDYDAVLEARDVADVAVVPAWGFLTMANLENFGKIFDVLSKVTSWFFSHAWRPDDDPTAGLIAGINRADADSNLVRIDRNALKFYQDADQGAKDLEAKHQAFDESLKNILGEGLVARSGTGAALPPTLDKEKLLSIVQRLRLAMKHWALTMEGNPTRTQVDSAELSLRLVKRVLREALQPGFGARAPAVVSGLETLQPRTEEIGKVLTKFIENARNAGLP